MCVRKITFQARKKQCLKSRAQREIGKRQWQKTAGIAENRPQQTDLLLTIPDTGAGTWRNGCTSRCFFYTPFRAAVSRREVRPLHAFRITVFLLTPTLAYSSGAPDHACTIPLRGLVSLSPFPFTGQRAEKIVAFQPADVFGGVF